VGALYFRPSARLQRYLGRELIADPNLAVVEFVKNAYDAGAQDVYIDFWLVGPSPPEMVISDNGSGMDEVSFRRNWMHPGYSEKADGAHASSPREATTAPPPRVPVGEKGLGRLAAGRLGNRLEVFTRQSEDDDWFHPVFEWATFDDMDAMIDEIEIPYDYVTEVPDARVRVGTIILIRDLSQKWDGRIPGRPVPGRKRTRLGRLKQDLELLLRPLGPTDPGFTIHFRSDSIAEAGDDVGTITPESASEDADYVYEFSLGPSKGGDLVVRRELQRSASIAAEVASKRHEPVKEEKLAEAAARDGRPTTLESGPLVGRFYYTPPPAAKRAREVDAVGHGVLLYRDGVLVEPYGLDGNDWLGVSARKAQRQGYALVQPSTFSGYVLISRDDNPELRDMSNRQGLVENDASEEFIRHVKAEFRVFEGLVNEELKRRWATRAEQAAKQSEESARLAALRLDALVHSLGQPLIGLRTDVSALRYVAKQKGLPHAIRESLERLANSAGQHLDQMTLVLERFRTAPVTERADTGMDNLVGRAVREVEPLAASFNVKLRVDDMPSRTVFVHEELVGEAIKELLRNAIEAPRSGAGFVRVSHREEDGDIVVDIVDDGPGIDGAGSDTDLTSIQSTKGRPGEGLSNVADLITASRGRVRIAATGPEGTHVEVRLPTRLGGLKSG
jgi:signal transduction histidine kinase